MPEIRGAPCQIARHADAFIIGEPEGAFSTCASEAVFGQVQTTGRTCHERIAPSIQPLPHGRGSVLGLPYRSGMTTILPTPPEYVSSISKACCTWFNPIWCVTMGVNCLGNFESISTAVCPV
jgi:hypothetical protein